MIKKILVYPHKRMVIKLLSFGIQPPNCKFKNSLIKFVVKLNPSCAAIAIAVGLT